VKPLGVTLVLNPQLDLRSKSAFVTGASRGIGLATAKVLSNYGATVILAARSSDKLEYEAEQIRRSGGSAYAITCDVSDYASVTSAVQYGIDIAGRIDILVNNAGIIEPLAHLAESDPIQWAQAVDINLKGTYFCMRAALPSMIKTGAGVVVNVSSGAANSALVGWSHYCSTKAAAKKVTEVAQHELSSFGIRVVGISPGTVATGMMEKIRAAQINAVSALEWESHIPPHWVGEGIAYLCGPDAEDLAGTELSLRTPTGRLRVGLPELRTADG